MTRVVLVDDHGLFLAGVRAELGDAVEVVGEAGTVADAIPLIKELDPDVVLLDVHLPDGSGAAIVNAVALERPAVKFLALSVSDAAEDVIAVIRAGARGYVTKTIAGPELIAAVESPKGTRSSRRGSPASSSTRSAPGRSPRRAPRWTSSPRASGRCSS
jgi:DNA-binding NarL/FixJ family response regulator